MRYQRGRVFARVCTNSGLRDECMWLVGTGCGRRVSPAQLRTGVPHVGSGRTARADGFRRVGVVGMRLGPCTASRVADRRGPRHNRTRSATGTGHVVGLLLCHCSITLVRHGWSGKSSQ